MIPSFQISLDTPILHGLVTIGKFDGKHTSLACATGTDNILIHCPHLHNSQSDQEIRQLSVNRKISALTCGAWPLPTATAEEKKKETAKSKPVGDIIQVVKNVNIGSGSIKRTFKQKKVRDALLVGTQTNLLCYDVEENSDLFYKDVPEGLNAIAFGKLPSTNDPLAIVGGNCSLQGFDSEGNEMYWTVTGDNVTALAFRDNNQLLVGSEDFEIRAFEGEDIVMEKTESDVIVNLTHIKGKFFAYGLANGTIGVYEDAKRVWHAKAKNDIMDIAVYDLDDDGVPELITGWSNGKLEVRDKEDGHLIFKDRYSSPVSGICIADYRMQGAEEIICCTANGEIRGYARATNEEVKDEIQTTVDDMKIKALNVKIMALKLEKMAYERNLDVLKTANTKDRLGAGTISQDTKAITNIVPDEKKEQLEIQIEATEGAVIKMVILESKILFQGGPMVIKRAKPSNRMYIPVDPRVLTEHCDLHIKTIVGHMSSFQDHIFESEHKIPRFSHFINFKNTGVDLPSSNVKFGFNERIKSIVNWVNENFGIDYKTDVSGRIQLWFRGVASKEILVITFVEADSNSKGQLQIHTDDIDLAGDLVSSITKKFRIKNLESVADFPLHMTEFKKTLAMVDEHHSTRLKLQADIADSSNLVKSLVIKAEDARMLNNMESMKRMYAQLYELNLELIGEYKKRANNHAELLKHLKVVNQMIQRASKLRFGKHKSEVVAACRKAIKSNSMHELFDIIKFGRIQQ